MIVSDSINDLLTEKNTLINTVTEQQSYVTELKISFIALHIKYQLLKKHQ